MRPSHRTSLRRIREVGTGSWDGVVLGALLIGLLLASRVPRAEAGAPLGTRAVASESELAAAEALNQMKAGGNAIDAAIAATFMAGVTSPTSSGIGGGGFALLWLAAERRAALIDFRETAPRGIQPRAFEGRPFDPAHRGQLVGVPGEVSGLWELHRRLGRRRWQQVVLPAARRARRGYPVGRHLGSTLASVQTRLPTDTALQRVFYPRGAPAPVGGLIRNPALATTLERIAAEGPRAFYEGAVAASIVASVRGAGGAMTKADLAGYQPVVRDPLVVHWEGFDVYTMPPPSAGGLMLAQTLGMLGREELRQLDPAKGAYPHLLAEAMRGAIADRMRYLGDPDLEPIDLPRLIDPQRLARRRASIRLDRTQPLPSFGLEEAGTHHLVTADAAGNLVSLTTTINRAFGARITAGGTGVLLNDELGDFTTLAEVSAFGMNQSPNRPRPGARPVSSMTPTIVLRDGRGVLALGGSGGTAIATNVTQVLLARLALDTEPDRAVTQPRVYVPTRGDDTLWLDPGAPRALVADLTARGEVVGTTPFVSSAVQLIAIEQGRYLPVADPRKYGAVGVE